MALSNLRKTRDELRKRREHLHDLERETRDAIQQHNKRIDRKRTKKEEAEHKARREQLADQIDSLIGERRKLEDNLESIDARTGNVRAMLRRTKKRIRDAKERAQSKQFYASKNFRYSEFDCNDGRPVPEAAKPALRHLCQTYLEPLRSRYGSVHINSGYRHEAYNRSIGGASDSIHIYDNHPDAVAADHTASNAAPSTVYAYEDTLGPGGLGRYSTFVHIDNRQRIGYSHARWSG